MRLFTRTVTIAKPREAVFDFVVDFSQASRWRQSVRTMEPVTPGPLRAGTVIRTIFDVAGDDLTLDLKVAACERPSLWRHTVDEHDFHTTVEYRFEQDAAGTRVTMRCDVQPVTWYGWLSVPLLSLQRGKMYQEQLPQLKRALETS
ncbi:MAG TPA: SRPBCC family protein [Vicinamibacterales bacterium]